MSEAPPPSLAVAFKEWATVVLALERGVQSVILRKGGLAEDGAGFAVEHRRFWLFPTYFHQQLEGVRPEHKPLLDEAMCDRPPPGRLHVRCWAEVTATRVIQREEDLALLEHRHIYERHVTEQRLHGRHGKVLHVIEVTVHRAARTLDLPMLDVYGGCRSWIELEVSQDAPSEGGR